jgi:hypothetical protein
MRFPKSLAQSVLGSLWIGVPALLSSQQGTQPQGVERTINGTVVDVSCKFGHGLSGPDHLMCAQVCADKGIPLAILGDDGKLYVPVSAGMPGDNTNPTLRPHAEQKVTVKGTVFAAGGANAIRIASITPARR